MRDQETDRDLRLGKRGNVKGRTIDDLDQDGRLYERALHNRDSRCLVVRYSSFKQAMMFISAQGSVCGSNIVVGVFNIKSICNNYCWY